MSTSGIDWSEEELAERIGAYHGIVIRSATKMTEELIARATKLQRDRPGGRGGGQRRRRGGDQARIVVANAPESNVVTAAEHTMALLLALARNVPQAHMSLTSGKWERSKFSGVELFEKTLGILGFGRIGQLVAQRARGFGMRVIAFDPFVSAERYRELGVEKAADSPMTSTHSRTSSPSTCRRRPRPKGLLNAAHSRRCATACAISTSRAAG